MLDLGVSAQQMFVELIDIIAPKYKTLMLVCDTSPMAKKINQVTIHSIYYFCYYKYYLEFSFLKYQ